MLDAGGFDGEHHAHEHHDEAENSDDDELGGDPDDERRDIDRPFASTPRSLRAVRSVAGLILILLAVLGSLLWWEHLRSSAPEGGPPRMGVPEAPPG